MAIPTRYVKSPKTHSGFDSAKKINSPAGRVLAKLNEKATDSPTWFYGRTHTPKIAVRLTVSVFTMSNFSRQIFAFAITADVCVNLL
jgi:hypothetical protein